VAADAAFFQSFMLEYEGAGLGDVTLETDSVSTQQQRSAAFDLLWQVRVTAFDRVSDVWVVAIRAAHLAFQHRMVVRHLKSRPHFEVALETGVRRSARVNDLALIAARRNVQTSRTVAGFATHLLGVVPGSFQTRMSRGPKIPGNRFVTGLACFRTNKLRAGNAGRCEDGAIRLERAARKQNDGQRGCSPNCPQQFLAFTAQPYD